MDELNQQQRQALLRKMIDNFNEFQYSEKNDGTIILEGNDAHITVYNETEGYNCITFQYSGGYFEENNPLWRNLPETLRNLKKRKDEEDKKQEDIEKKERNELYQKRLNDFLGIE